MNEANCACVCGVIIYKRKLAYITRKHNTSGISTLWEHTSVISDVTHSLKYFSANEWDIFISTGPRLKIYMFITWNERIKAYVIVIVRFSKIVKREKKKIKRTEVAKKKCPTTVTHSATIGDFIKVSVLSGLQCLHHPTLACYCSMISIIFCGQQSPEEVSLLL